MKFLDYIEHLRHQPEPVRRSSAFIVSIVITLLIFIGWLASFKPQVVRQEEPGPSPLEVIRRDLKSIFEIFEK